MPNEKKRPTFGKLQEEAINAKLGPATPAGPTLGDPEAWVLQTTRIKRATALRLLQLAYHMPGHFRLQDFYERAINEALARHPEADRPIPEPDYSEMLRKNKKLAG